MRTLTIFSSVFFLLRYQIFREKMLHEVLMPQYIVVRGKSMREKRENCRRCFRFLRSIPQSASPPLQSRFSIHASVRTTDYGLQPLIVPNLLYWRMPTNSRRQRGNSVILAWDWRMPLNLLFQGYAQHSGLKFIPRPRPKTDNRGGFGNNLGPCCCQISLSEHKHRIRMNYIRQILGTCVCGEWFAQHHIYSICNSQHCLACLAAHWAICNAKPERKPKQLPIAMWNLPKKWAWSELKDMPLSSRHLRIYGETSPIPHSTDKGV